MEKFVYETVMICKPDRYKKSIKNTEELCQKYTGDEYKIKKDMLGVKKLAYKLKDKYTEGYYAVFTWMGTPEDVAELERQLRIDDDVLKFMTIKVDETDAPEFELLDNSISKSEQDNTSIDALDVMLGFAKYKN